MDTDTAINVLNALDEAERILGEIRLHGGVGAGHDTMTHHRELLDEARHQLDIAHALA